MRQLAAWTTVTLLNLPGWQRQRATASEPTIAGIVEATADWLRHTWSDRPSSRRQLARLITRYYQPLRREPPTELVAVRRSIVAGGVSIASLIASATADRPEQLITELSMPTMILAGKHDRVASPTWCRQLADLGGTRLRILPGGHNAWFPYAAMADQEMREAVQDWCA